MNISNKFVFKLEHLLAIVLTLNKGLKGKVTNNKFTIISHNCWGAEVYRELEMQYNTPFVGLFVPPTDYLKMLKNLKKYMSMELKFINVSKYRWINIFRKNYKNNKYPIGVLGDVEINFLHYLDEKEAKEKWTRRVKRINYDNLYIELSDTDGLNSNIYNQYIALPYRRKVCFVADKKWNLKDTVFIKDAEKYGKVMDGQILYTFSKKYFNIANWLNR